MTATTTTMLTIEEIADAVARGWSMPNTAHKEKDADLVFAITEEVASLLRSRRAPAEGDAPAADEPETCPHAANPAGRYRIRCQLGKRCATADGYPLFATQQPASAPDALEGE